MKPYQDIYNRIITSDVFRTDGKPIDLPAALTELANAVHACPEDINWELGEHTEAPLDSLIVGAYWALTEWHAGQWSPEYAALCALGEVFQPGCTGAPSPEDSEWSAYVLTGQALGGHRLYEPTEAPEGWEWWKEIPSPIAGSAIIATEGEEEEVLCASEEEADWIAGDNPGAIVVWKPRA